MTKSLEERIRRKKEKRDQLNREIRQAENNLQTAKKKERDSRLMQWGIAVEQALNDPQSDLNEKTIVRLCKKYLSNRSLKKAVTGPLEPFADHDDAKGEEEPRQSRQQQPQDQQSQRQDGQQANRSPQSE